MLYEGGGWDRRRGEPVINIQLVSAVLQEMQPPTSFIKSVASFIRTNPAGCKFDIMLQLCMGRMAKTCTLNHCHLIQESIQDSSKLSPSAWEKSSSLLRSEGHTSGCVYHLVNRSQQFFTKTLISHLTKHSSPISLGRGKLWTKSTEHLSTVTAGLANLSLHAQNKYFSNCVDNFFDTCDRSIWEFIKPFSILLW